MHGKKKKRTHPKTQRPGPKAPSSEHYDLVVLGAGVAGLISCIVARQLQRRVALVEPMLGCEAALFGGETGGLWGEKQLFLLFGGRKDV